MAILHDVLPSDQEGLTSGKVDATLRPSRSRPLQSSSIH